MDNGESLFNPLTSRQLVGGWRARPICADLPRRGNVSGQSFQFNPLTYTIVDARGPSAMGMEHAKCWTY